MATLLALIIFLFPLAYSPGPGNLFFAANGARFGLRATIPANAGYHFATIIVTFAIGIGLAGVLGANSTSFQILRYAGAAYVFWLAWKVGSAGRLGQRVEAQAAGFWSGVWLLLLNPKAYVIIGLMFSQFLTTGDVGEVAVISVVFTLNNCLAFTIWTLMGDRLGRLFRSDQSARALNIGLGIMLAAVAVWMIL